MQCLMIPRLREFCCECEFFFLSNGSETKNKVLLSQRKKCAAMGSLIITELYLHPISKKNFQHVLLAPKQKYSHWSSANEKWALASLLIYVYDWFCGKTASMLGFLKPRNAKFMGLVFISFVGFVFITFVGLVFTHLSLSVQSPFTYRHPSPLIHFHSSPHKHKLLLDDLSAKPKAIHCIWTELTRLDNLESDFHVAINEWKNCIVKTQFLS